MKNLQKSLQQQNLQNFHYKVSWKLVTMTIEHWKIRNITKKGKRIEKMLHGIAKLRYLKIDKNLEVKQLK